MFFFLFEFIFFFWTVLTIIYKFIEIICEKLEDYSAIKSQKECPKHLGQNQKLLDINFAIKSSNMKKTFKKNLQKHTNKLNQSTPAFIKKKFSFTMLLKLRYKIGLIFFCDFNIECTIFSITLDFK